MFVIEDEIHAEHQGQFESFHEALVELRRRAKVPWDEAPNVAPCMSWRTCERDYVILEFDDSSSPWKELRRVPVLNVSASGTKWAVGFEFSNMTAADIHGPWVDPNWETGLAGRIRKCWSIPIAELPDAALALFLRQQIAVGPTMEEAQLRLAAGQPDDSEMYEGELAAAVEETKRRLEISDD